MLFSREEIAAAAAGEIEQQQHAPVPVSLEIISFLFRCARAGFVSIRHMPFPLSHLFRGSRECK
jgi:hypothetical protein